ncbi:hypothetical protein BO78DRAFT_77355 [Aspergillus sclerotiicarbonarius CBS 121057]|uniref:Uncharacterized protein n=1 Tax=Aspergillus sclerotiicarbonarius (strain CBS 121057 / IBT 28362) TaxID=1448318 RepID=A0A319EDE1_ASPSB|nr:hypothetical protein BO78DRAFT_77355 [Aspergillus sclerotiicarbonarius CBS 121057]
MTTFLDPRTILWYHLIINAALVVIVVVWLYGQLGRVVLISITLRIRGGGSSPCNNPDSITLVKRAGTEGYGVVTMNIAKSSKRDQ